MKKRRLVKIWTTTAKLMKKCSLKWIVPPICRENWPQTKFKTRTKKMPICSMMTRNQTETMMLKIWKMTA
jgi:hypothetical protein